MLRILYIVLLATSALSCPRRGEYTALETELSSNITNFHLRHNPTARIIKKYVRDFPPSRYGQLLQIEYGSSLQGIGGHVYLANSRGHIFNEVNPEYMRALGLVAFDSADEYAQILAERTNVELPLPDEEVCLEWARRERAWYAKEVCGTRDSG